MQIPDPDTSPGDERSSHPARASRSEEPAAEPLVPGRPPVYILYWTAEVGDDGRLHLYDDPSGVDSALAAALDAASRGGRIDGDDRPPGTPDRIAER